MSFLPVLKRAVEPMLAQRGPLVRSVLRSIIVGIQGPINALFIGVLGSLLETGMTDQFYQYIGVYAGVILLYRIVLEATKQWGWPETYFARMKRIHQYYMRIFMELDGNYLEKLGTGKLISIINNGFEKWTGILVDGLHNIVGLLLGMVFGVYFAFKLGWIFALLYIAVFGLIIWLAVYFDQPSIKYRDRRRDALDNYTRHLVRIIMSRTEILQNKKTDYEVARSGNHLDEANYHTAFQAIYLSRQFNIPRTIFSFFKIVLYVGGAWMFVQGSITISYFSAIIGFSLVIDELLIRFIQNYKNITKDRNRVTKLWSVFDSAPKVIGYDTGSDFQYGGGAVCIDHLSYTYDQGSVVFDDFSCTFATGKKIALVGPSGGGKSTFLKLLAGYLHAQGGSIKLGEQYLPTMYNLGDSAVVSLESYYQHIGYLSQEPNVFDGTVKENLLYGMGDHGGQEALLTNILRLARCERAYDLPQGLDTEIGERGVRLSGGQKQRLAIAKIMLKNPDIILLDEPTSALDSDNEALVTEALNNLFSGRTVIIVAHRLQTVKHADEILYIDAGMVIERGTHEQLLLSGGAYARMVELQSGF